MHGGHLALVMHACRAAQEAAPGVPAHALAYMHALEIAQRYGDALAQAARLLRSTRCGFQLPYNLSVTSVHRPLLAAAQRVWVPCMAGTVRMALIGAHI